MQVSRFHNTSILDCTPHFIEMQKQNFRATIKVLPYLQYQNPKLNRSIFSLIIPTATLYRRPLSPAKLPPRGGTRYCRIMVQFDRHRSLGRIALSLVLLTNINRYYASTGIRDVYGREEANNESKSSCQTSLKTNVCLPLSTKYSRFA